MIHIGKTYKDRVHPTRSQVSNPENRCSMCGHLHNQVLAERRDTYERTGEAAAFRIQQNRPPQLKIERPWCKGVDSQVLQDVLNRLDKSHAAFCRRGPTGTEAPGFPKFKKRGQWNSITYPRYSAFPGGEITVPEPESVKVVCHREIPETAEIKTLTISREGCKWFACFPVVLPLDIEPEQDLHNPIGIDSGLNDFLYDSDGFSVPTPEYPRKLQAEPAPLRRRPARATRRSPKWYKLLRAIRKCHYKIRCPRNDFLHKQASALQSRYDLILHENLNIRSMSRMPKPVRAENGEYPPNGAAVESGLNKPVSDAGGYRSPLMLKYKSVELGRREAGVLANNPSRKCSSCGRIVKKSSAVRTLGCSCGLVAGRDHNAAPNKLTPGLENSAAKVAWMPGGFIPGSSHRT